MCLVWCWHIFQHVSHYKWVSGISIRFDCHYLHKRKKKVVVLALLDKSGFKVPSAKSLGLRRWFLTLLLLNYATECPVTGNLC